MEFGRSRASPILCSMENGLKVNVLGVGVDPISTTRALDTVTQWLESGHRPKTVALANVHSVMESQSRPWLQAFYNGAGLVLADGMPLARLARWAGYSLAERIPGSTFMAGLRC